jgi:Flp pilus assembly pilin Flp
MAPERDDIMSQRLNQTWTRLRHQANLLTVVCLSRILRDETGQDLIEYALMAATIAVATAAIFPQSIAPNISAIFSKVNSSLGSANL